MTKFAIIGLKPRSPADWVLARIGQHRITDMEQERNGLEAMLHWRDPVERRCKCLASAPRARNARTRSDRRS
jgi:hypothetical protein